MSKPSVVVLKTLCVIFVIMMGFSLNSWIHGNRGAWVPLLACGVVVGYTAFLFTHFGKPRPVKTDDDEDDE